MDLSNFEILRDIVVKGVKGSSLGGSIKIKETTIIYSTEVEEFIEISSRVPQEKESEALLLKETLAKEISTKIHPEYSNEKLVELFKIQIGLSEKDKFYDLKVFNQKGEEVTLQHNEGEVLLVDIWATWCQYCLKPMAENIKIAKDLEGKAIRIVGISCDKDQEKWKDLLEANSWSSIEQYNNDNIRSLLGISSIPCIIVVNQKGIVEYVGHPGTIKLEEGLIGLCEGKEDCFKVVKQEDKFSKNEWWITKSIDEQHAIVKSILKDIHLSTQTESVKFAVITNTTYNENYETIHNCAPTLFGSISKEELALINEQLTNWEKKYDLVGFKNLCKLVV